MTHVLFFPDGNRRYARENGISYGEAYTCGAQSLALLTDFFLTEGRADELTYVATCAHTRTRDDGTVGVIDQIAAEVLSDLARREFFLSREVRFAVVTHGNQAPDFLRTAWSAVEEQSQTGTRLTRVLFDYDLTKDEEHAWHGAQNYAQFSGARLIPPVDLVLRPLEMRLSNGPVYAMGQAQMIILPVPNPALKRKHLEAAWDEYREHMAYRRTTNPVHRLTA